MKVCFVVNDLQLSGGIGVVLHHARELTQRHGFEVDLALAREQDDPHWEYEHLAGLTVCSLAEAREQRYDVALSTWWETAFTLFSLRAERYAAFVQSLEDRFYAPDEPERLGASLTLDLPVSFITEARWIAGTLAELRPEAPCHFVRNGVDKSVFAPAEEVEPNVSDPLRILVEGNPEVRFKGVPEAIAAAVAVPSPRTVTVVTANHAAVASSGADRVIGPLGQRELAAEYARTDVVLKLSRVEGMYGPPLEGMHMGATCVTTPVTGHEEYIAHGVNAMVVEWDDQRGTTRMLDLLAHDRELLHHLRCGALETARAWPGWEQQGEMMALALQRIHAAPQPAGPPAAAALLPDLRAGMEQYRLHLHERKVFRQEALRLQKVRELPVVSTALAVRDRPGGKLAVRLLRRLAGR